MRRRDTRFLEQLFRSGLAVAAAACANPQTNPQTPPPVAPTSPTPGQAPTSTPDDGVVPPSGPVAGGTPPKPSSGSAAYVAQFKGVDSYASAVPGAELLGFIDEGSQCSPSPCAAEWKTLVATAAQGAVLRKAGKLELLTSDAFERTVPTIDTPVKAAMRFRLRSANHPATCSDLEGAGYTCPSTTAVAFVRSEGRGFEVITYGERNVCSGSEIGFAPALGILVSDLDGKVHRTENAFTDETGEQAQQSKPVRCHYPSRGRMYEGFVDTPPECEVTAHAYYVRAARQEAAAIVAFQRLARELEAHGAPASLCAAAHKAARDEIKHAAMFQKHAKRFASLTPVIPQDVPPTLGVRSLDEVLWENAVEGCANETFAAVVATYQAEYAPTEELRAMHAQIARDEQEHALLAYQIHTWALQTLPTEKAEALEAVRREACARVSTEMTTTPMGQAQGEPEAVLARRAFAEIVQALPSAQAHSPA